ncbi:MAG: gas vesicle protein GvpG [Actinomycetes bacterium]
MGLITGILGLPVAPLRGTIWVAEQILQAAEEEYYDPARIKEQLEAVERARAAGELTDDAATELEDALVDRLIESRGRANRQEG